MLDVVLDQLDGEMLFPALGLFAFCALGLFVMMFGRRWQGRMMSGTGRIDEGRVIGCVGLMGSGKTSFMVLNWAVPMLRQGGTVIANFGIDDSDLPGKSIKLLPDTFGLDVLGVGSSLNYDANTGEPMSGWFYDTACNCGLTHDTGCGRVQPAVGTCCPGFAAQRACGCRSALLILDESHAFVPASNSRPLPVELLTWFTMARKNHIEIIWATQYYKWVHSSVRRLTQDVFMCTPRIGDGLHTADLVRLGPGGELGRDIFTSIKFDNRPIRGRYDTYEVIIPAHTAHELAGTMSKRSLRS